MAARISNRTRDHGILVDAKVQVLVIIHLHDMRATRTSLHTLTMTPYVLYHVIMSFCCILLNLNISTRSGCAVSYRSLNLCSYTDHYEDAETEKW